MSCRERLSDVVERLGDVRPVPTRFGLAVGCLFGMNVAEGSAEEDGLAAGMACDVAAIVDCRDCIAVMNTCCCCKKASCMALMELAMAARADVSV